jgi:hypothetical protein
MVKRIFLALTLRLSLTDCEDTLSGESNLMMNVDLRVSFMEDWVQESGQVSRFAGSESSKRDIKQKEKITS